MLQELRVENLALIESLLLEFNEQGNGLFIFTGETGAGKSIILQAIHLLTGRRASSSWIRSDRDQAVIEAVFSIRPEQYELHALLQENDLESENQCIIRRVISKNGRSKIHINDNRITARLAGLIGDQLINIASQHDHQLLLAPRHQLDFVDGYGELLTMRRDFGQLFAKWQKLSSDLRDLREKEQDKEQRRDFLRFQLREIEETGPELNEDVDLMRERDVLKSSSALMSLTGESLHLLQGAILENVAVLRKNIEQAAAMDESLEELAARVASLCYEIEEVEPSLRSYREAVPMDPGRLEYINDRLAKLKQLQRKYGASIEDVLEFAEKAKTQLDALDSMDERLDSMEKELESVSRKAMQMAGKLSAARKKIAKELSAAMLGELHDLSFPEARFEVIVRKPEGWVLDGLQSTGQDHVEFLFSANPGEELKPLAKVASGGELSRLMLAMKCLLAKRDLVDTVIFDEVDSGIGGKAAEAVAAKICQLARHHQVFCITHLPQIAAHGDFHFLVDKNVNQGRTVSTIVSLDEDKRIHELARMLDGNSSTEQTIDFARELAGRRKATA